MDKVKQITELAEKFAKEKIMFKTIGSFILLTSVIACVKFLNTQNSKKKVKSFLKVSLVITAVLFTWWMAK